MIDACKKLGLKAAVIDLYDLEKLGQRFDAIYSLNVLLHVPPQDLEHVLTAISNCLQPNGLFFYGVYGGTNKEEMDTDPTRMNMPRYFSFLDDESLLKVTPSLFTIVNSEVIDIGDSQAGLRFRLLLLREK